MRTLQSELCEKGLCKDCERHTTKRRKPQKERFSRREIEELMGTKRQTYVKVRGSFRSK